MRLRPSPGLLPYSFPSRFFHRIRNHRHRRQLLPLYSALVIVVGGNSVDGGSVDSSPYSVLHRSEENYIQKILIPG